MCPLRRTVAPDGVCRHCGAAQPAFRAASVLAARLREDAVPQATLQEAAVRAGRAVSALASSEEDTPALHVCRRCRRASGAPGPVTSGPADCPKREWA